jgi:hypothetical protein
VALQGEEQKQEEQEEQEEEQLQITRGRKVGF